MVARKHTKGQALVEMAFMALVLATFISFIVNASTAYRTKHILDQALKVGVQSVVMDTRQLPETLVSSWCPDCRGVNLSTCTNTTDPAQDTIGCRAIFRTKEYLDHSFIDVNDPTLVVTGIFRNRTDPNWSTVSNVTFEMRASVTINWMLLGDLNILTSASSLADSEKLPPSSTETFTFTFTGKA